MDSEIEQNARAPYEDLRLAFIVGSHRSGTSILYKLLAATGGFNVVTVFHVLNRNRLLDLHTSDAMDRVRSDVAREFRAAGLHDEYGRSVTPDTLEEYGFALEHQQRRPIVTPKNLPGFVKFCKALNTIQDPARRLLLKNPFDTPNFLFLRHSFPNAPLIFIHRHPAGIIDSQIRLLRQMMEQRSDYDAMLHAWYRKVYDGPVRRTVARMLFSERFPILFRLVADVTSNNCDYIVKHFGRVGSAIGITYPQLCSEPAVVLAEILTFLRMRSEAALEYSDIIRRRTSLLPEVEQRIEWIVARNRRYCEMFGLELGDY